MKPKTKSVICWTCWALGIVGGLAVGFVLWRVVGFWPHSHFDSLEKAGQFGDSFGFVNSFFSGLAMIGVIIAIVLQSRELGLQRKELRISNKERRLQRKEMNESQVIQRATAKAQEESSRALEGQASTTLLATYLDALRTAKEFGPVEELTVKEERHYRALESLLLHVETKLDEDFRSVLSSDAEYLSRRLKSMAEASKWEYVYSDLNILRESFKKQFGKLHIAYSRILPDLREIERCIKNAQEVAGDMEQLHYITSRLGTKSIVAAQAASNTKLFQKIRTGLIELAALCTQAD